MFNISSNFCSHCCYLISKYFHHPQNETVLLTVILCSLFPQLPATTNLISVSMDLSVTDISYKCNHNIYSFLSLVSFFWCNFKIHSCCSMQQYLIPCYGHIIFYFIGRYVTFDYPFINWWRSEIFFHFLAVIYNSSMNNHVQDFAWTYISLWMELMDHVITLFWFLRLCKYVFHSY